jgi:hypothetical protein
MMVGFVSRDRFEISFLLPGLWAAYIRILLEVCWLVFL